MTHKINNNQNTVFQKAFANLLHKDWFHNPFADGLPPFFCLLFFRSYPLLCGAFSFSLFYLFFTHFYNCLDLFTKFVRKCGNLFKVFPVWRGKYLHCRFNVLQILTFFQHSTHHFRRHRCPAPVLYETDRSVLKITFVR